MADIGRVAQSLLEIVLQNARGRVSQATLEVLAQEQARGRVSQATLESLQHGQRGDVAQVFLEVLLGTHAPLVLPRFPAALAYGAQGGPGFFTDVVLMQAGQEQRNCNWAEALGRWDVGSIHRTRAEIEVLIAFFHAATQGQAGLFLFRDFTDDTFDNPIGVGDGSTRIFQVVKRYTVGPFQRERRLRHPVTSTLVVALDGVLVSAWTLDDSTGLLTFTTAPDPGVVVSASGDFEVVCRFTQDHLPITRVAPNLYSCEAIEIVEVRTHETLE